MGSLVSSPGASIVAVSSVSLGARSIGGRYGHRRNNMGASIVSGTSGAIGLVPEIGSTGALTTG